MENAHPRFEALVGAFASDLYRFAYWLCRDRHRAEDLAQETFLRAWRALGSLREEKAAKGWLFMILRREYARERERYQPPFEEAEPDLFAIESGCPAEALQLRRALGQLAEEYREPLLLQVLGGFSGEEIAGIMDIPPATVMTRLFRARQRMRAVLAPPESATRECKVKP